MLKQWDYLFSISMRLSLAILRTAFHHISYSFFRLCTCIKTGKRFALKCLLDSSKARTEVTVILQLQKTFLSWFWGNRKCVPLWSYRNTENEKCYGTNELQESVSTAISSSPKLSQVFLQPNRNMENIFSISFRKHRIEKGKQFLYFDHQNSLCSYHHCINSSCYM